MTKGSIYEMLKKKNGGGGGTGKRLLITVDVVGSAGVLKFVAKEDDLVSEVIHTALKCYAREGRLPNLGSDATNFLLYCANADAEALSPMEQIGSKHVRNFMLYRKHGTPLVLAEKGSNSWKAWLNKSLTFKILSH